MTVETVMDNAIPAAPILGWLTAIATLIATFLNVTLIEEIANRKMKTKKRMRLLEERSSALKGVRCDT